MAKTKAKTDDKAVTLEIEGIGTAELEVFLLGTSPLLCNRLSEKARHELLLPAAKKNAAERAMRLKHNPLEEYRASVYRSPDPEAPTRIVHPGGAFRKAIATAALDVPGSSKAQIGRLVRVVDYNAHVYGVPRLSCMIVRQAGINKTPDVRTRAILPAWACRLTVRYAHPLITERSVLALLLHAGEFIGVGDGRGEKGSTLTCGCFTQVQPDNPQFLRLLAEGGAAAQDEALESPEYHDAETAELIEWFDAELVRRDRQPPRSVPADKLARLAANGRPQLTADSQE